MGGYTHKCCTCGSVIDDDGIVLKKGNEPCHSCGYGLDDGNLTYSEQDEDYPIIMRG